jgi:hypothetical protein
MPLVSRLVIERLICRVARDLLVCRALGSTPPLGASTPLGQVQGDLRREAMDPW